MKDIYTWKEEFYPEQARYFQGDWKEHSIQKLYGLLNINLEKHNCKLIDKPYDNYPHIFYKIISDNNGKEFEVFKEEHCVACKIYKHQKHNIYTGTICSACPATSLIYRMNNKYEGTACMFFIDEFLETQDFEKLKKIIEEL